MNIYDIAKKCGVSISTVSRVMNNSGAVSEKTRKKVERAIAEEKFVPNNVARSLASNSTKLVGLMVPDVRNSFHAQVAYELGEILNSKGYVTILSNTTDLLDKKLEMLKVQEEQMVDAIITVGSSYGERKFLDESLKLSKNIPIVQINNYCPGLISVYCDEENGMLQSMKNFKNKGYEKPLFVSQPTMFETRAYESKKLGFIKGLEAYYPKVDFMQQKIYNFNKDIDKVFKFIDENNIDAIQFENDNLAIKFLKYFIDKKINIPEEMGLVGFDNNDATNYTYKRISSIDHRIHDHAQVAVDFLMKVLNGEDEFINYQNIIKPKFVAKETTRR
ncbi:MAG: LacI family DNA-binding transcriptional regulator [Peptoniphilaceae bacterium]|nr:LacI family DNA-binding transcriptional regulator [Peptoniphilaceae bacterium]MDY6018891.1 LacI family DNA-binding transcriptional regulator [Anaerococcus sp.]